MKIYIKFIIMTIIILLGVIFFFSFKKNEIKLNNETKEIINNSVEYHKENIIIQGEVKRSNLITYSVDEYCFSLTKNLIDKSFININDAIGNKFDFIKVNDSADITVNCYPYKYDSSPNSHYCDDEYCYTEYAEQTLGLSKGNLIDNNNSTIELYTGAMGLSTIEHEIIHSLGYSGHSVYGNCVMSAYSDSNQHICNETINKLKEIYNENYNN